MARSSLARALPRAASARNDSSSVPAKPSQIHLDLRIAGTALQPSWRPKLVKNSLTSFLADRLIGQSFGRIILSDSRFKGESAGYASEAPPPSFTGSDAFSYTVADQRGESAQGTAIVTVWPPLRFATIAASNGVCLSFQEIADQNYGIEVSSNLHGGGCSESQPKCFPANSHSRMLKHPDGPNAFTVCQRSRLLFTARTCPPPWLFAIWPWQPQTMQPSLPR